MRACARSANQVPGPASNKRRLRRGPIHFQASNAAGRHEPRAEGRGLPEETTPSDELRAPGLLVPGRNCWRIERARRVSFLVDAAAYFRAARSAMARAQRAVFILSWDINSRMRLVPEGARDGYPEPLGDFLNALVARRN